MTRARQEADLATVATFSSQLFFQGGFVRRGLAFALAVATSSLVAGCAARGGKFVMPSGAGEPLPEYSQLFEEATKTCRGVRTLTAEASLSGRVGGQKVRGKLHLGLAEPNAVRIEAVAPFGPPGFILAAHDGDGTLLLPRDNAAVKGVPAADLIDALAGLPLSPDELRAVATGCVAPGASAKGGQRFGDLAAITLEDGAVVYLRTRGNATTKGSTAAGAGANRTAAAGAPEIVAAQRKGLTVEYAESVNGLPRRVHLLSTAPSSTSSSTSTSSASSMAPSGVARADLTLVLSQVEINVSLEPAAFTVDVPEGAKSLTLDDLRRSGPLGKTNE
jgi:outer membrane lipoprotein-sorting protein